VLKRRDTLDSSIDSSRASSPALSVSTESGIVTIGYEDGLASVTSFSFPDTSRSVSSKSIEVCVVSGNGKADSFNVKTGRYELDFKLSGHCPKSANGTPNFRLLKSVEFHKLQKIVYFTQKV
jgi:hypothetical protein